MHLRVRSLMPVSKKWKTQVLSAIFAALNTLPPDKLKKPARILVRLQYKWPVNLLIIIDIKIYD